MGNINDKLEYMNGTKLDIRDALIEQKQEVPPSTPFRAYGDIIRGLDTTDTSDATATSNDILNGKTAYVNKEKLTGTMVDNGELTYTPSISSQNIPAGYTSGGTIAGVDSSIDNNIQSYNIKAGVRILGVEGNVEPDKPDQEKTVNPSTSIQEVTADIGYELAKVTVNAIETETKNVKSTTSSQTVTPTAGKFINEITVEPIDLESKVVTPTTSQQVITPSQDKDGIGQVTVSGVDASIDNNIVSENIKAGITILNTSGKSSVVDTEDANAVANKMISGYSAYVNGEKINGSIVPKTTLHAPSVSSIGLATDSQHPNQIRIGTATWQNVYLQNAGIALWFNQYNLASSLGIKANELKKGSTVLGITGNYTSDANATADDILENKTAYVNGNKVTGSMTDLGQLDITPTTTAQTIPAGYTSGGIVNAVPDETEVLDEQDELLDTQEIKISDLVTALNNKIALDLTNATSDANATASDILQGKTAYVNGQKIEGTNQGNIPNWSEIGYSDTPQPLLDDFTYSKSAYEAWNPANTSLTNFYRNDNLLKYVPNIDTRNVTIAQYTFWYRPNILFIPDLDLTNATDIYGMINGCSNLKYAPKLKFTKLLNMNRVFKDCTSLIYVPLMNTSTVTTMYDLFNGCTSLTSIPQFDTHLVTNFQDTFRNCTNLTTIPVFDTSSITNFTNTFASSTKLSNESLNNILQMCINAISYTGTKTLRQLGLTSSQSTICQTLSNWNDFVSAGWTTGY